MKIGPGVGSPEVEQAEPEQGSSKGSGQTPGQSAGTESPYAQTFSALKDEFSELGHSGHELSTSSPSSTHPLVHGGELQRPPRVSTK